MRTVVLHTQLKTQLVDVTAEVREVLDGQTAVIFVPHTTAGVVLQASGADASAVAATSKTALEQLVDVELAAHRGRRSQSVGPCPLGAYGLLGDDSAGERPTRAW